MTMNSKSQIYEKGLELAEAGQHEQALKCIKEHLKVNPGDGQAWNDAGAIIYCLGEVDEAIENFEKARELCGDSAEVLWNLCETYIDGGYPNMAVQLFDTMERMEILNPDVMNRTANAFLQQNCFGGAIETLLRSLKMNSEQEILLPMIEVIRSKRPKIAFFCEEKDKESESVFNYLNDRFRTEMHVDKSQAEIYAIFDNCDIAWFEGCGDIVTEASRVAKAKKMIARLSADDVYDGSPERVNWNNIDTLILIGNSFVKEALIEKVNDIEKLTKLMAVRHGINVDQFKFAYRNRGKKIACVSDLSAKKNPMFLLQCMQKLIYIDPDYRLYFAGEFEDKAVEHYVMHMVEKMNLSSVVFFDGRVNNVNAWFRDKHYIVSAGISESILSGVLEGMSCGLKPVVHNFPGADELLPIEVLFNLAEDFCGHITSETYEPQKYRSIVEEKFTRQAVMKNIHEMLVKLEKDMTIPRCIQTGDQSEQSVINVFSPSNAEPWCETVPEDTHSTQFKVPLFETVPQRPANDQQPVKAIPIKPVMPESLEQELNIIMPPGIPNQADTFDTNSVESSWSGDPIEQSASKASSNSVEKRRSIDDIAAEALRVSQVLNELAKQGGVDPKQQSWNQTDAGSISQMGYDSLDAAVRNNEVSKIASEFSEDIRPVGNTFKQVEVQQIPFGV